MNVEDPYAKSLAAYSVMESLILELCSKDIISKDRLLGVLDDAASAHEQLAEETGHPDDGHAHGNIHRIAAELIRTLARQLHLS